MNNHLKRLWAALVRADTDYFRARQMFLQHRGDSLSELADALEQPAERGAALRILETLPVDARRSLLGRLVDLATFTSGDIVAVRNMITNLGQPWLSQHLGGEVDRVLSAPSATDEEYRRLAELLREVDASLLRHLVERAKSSSDPHIREVGEDFGSA